MKRMILVSNYTDSYEVNRLIEESQKLSIRLELLPMTAVAVELSPKLDNELEVWVSPEILQQIAERRPNKKDFLIKSGRVSAHIDGVSGVLFRGLASKNVQQNRELKYFVIEFFNKHNVYVFNGKVLQQPSLNKLWQHLIFIKYNIPFVPTIFSASKDALKHVEQILGFPVFLKPHKGSHGRGAAITHSIQELEKRYLEYEFPSYLFIQQKLETRWDIRVLVVGGQILGAMKRIAGKDAIVTNFSAGGNVEAYNLKAQEKTLVQKIINAFGLEYAGIDLMYDKAGNLYVLEVNVNAQFKGFEKATGVNVARRLLECTIR